MVRDIARIQAIAAAVAIALLSLLFGESFLSAVHSSARVQEIIVCPADGNGSESALGNAIGTANGNPGPDSIIISPTATVCTFTLAGAAGDYGTGAVGLPLISDTLTIRAAGPGAILERAEGAAGTFRLLESEADLTLEDLTLRNGNTLFGRRGGAIYAHQALTLTNVILSGNLSYGGGAAYAVGSVALDQVTLANNETRSHDPSHGGGLWTEGDLQATTITVTGNTAFDCGCGGDDADGGGIYVGGSAVISDATFSHNESVQQSGGGLYVGGDLTINNSAFYSNTANYAGGGLHLKGTLTLSATHFGHNQALLGGGLALDFEGTAGSILAGDFQYNVADNGGGLYGPQNVIVADTHFLGNQARMGGAAWIDEGTVENSVFTANSAGGPAKYDGGGALFVFYDATIRNNRFLSNTAPVGGAVFIAHIPPSGNVSLLLNNLWIDNEAGEGAALFAGVTSDEEQNGHTEFNHNTVVHQTGSNGSALQIIDGTANVYNNIITQHTIGVSAGSQASVVSDYNLFFQNDIRHANVPPGANNLDSDPLFVDPAAGDYHLQADSPAVDSGLDLGVATDLDDVPRPQGDGFDRGAYEYVIPEGPTYGLFLPLITKAQ